MTLPHSVAKSVCQQITVSSTSGVSFGVFAHLSFQTVGNLKHAISQVDHRRIDRISCGSQVLRDDRQLIFACPWKALVTVIFHEEMLCVVQMMSGNLLGEFQMLLCDRVLDLKQRISEKMGKTCNLLYGEVMLENHNVLGELGQGILKLSAVLINEPRIVTSYLINIVNEIESMYKESSALRRRLCWLSHSDFSRENVFLAKCACDDECCRWESEKEQQAHKRRTGKQVLEVEKIARRRSDEKLVLKRRILAGQASSNLKKYSVRKR
jgi:hypothetical protein